MIHFKKQLRLELREETILILFALIVPMTILPTLAGI